MERQETVKPAARCCLSEWLLVELGTHYLIYDFCMEYFDRRSEKESSLAQGMVRAVANLSRIMNHSPKSKRED